MMELRDFISTTINELLSAIVQSQRFAAQNNIHAEVAPRDVLFQRGGATHFKQVAGDGMIITNVAFDVAVTATDEQSAKAGAGIKVVGIDLRLGADASKTATTSAVSRISFNVPVILPDPDQHEQAKV